MNTNTHQRSIAIVTIGNTYRLPYLERYISASGPNNTIHLISWDRESVEDQTKGVEKHEFRYAIGGGIFAKILGYCAYGRYVRKTLSSLDLDYVVVTPTQTALLLSNYLRKKYFRRYIVDIRDYAHENLSFVRRLEKTTFSDSVMNVISSAGYLEFLPSQCQYYVCHNDRQLDEEEVKNIQSREMQRNPIRIGCIGYISYHEQHKRMIDLFANDPRFELLFIGSGSDPLESYCHEKGINNVCIRGKFNAEDTLSLYADVDIVNGIYGENCPELDYALSNKLYFATRLGIPILANKNTFTATIASQYRIGFEFDMSSADSPASLYKYYCSLDRKTMLSNGARFMEQVSIDDAKFESRINELFNDES